jgi:hypothetical protein
MNRRKVNMNRSRRLSVTAVAGLMMMAVVASCGWDGRAATSSNVDPCLLLTRTEAAAAMDVDPTLLMSPSRGPSPSKSCEFATRPDSAASGDVITIQVLADGDAGLSRREFDLNRQDTGGHTVAGVGESAYQSTGTCDALTVLQKQSLFEISLQSRNVTPCSAAQRGTLMVLGTEVVRRL